MKLNLSRLVLGPIQNNVFILSDDESKAAVIIDPSFHAAKQQAFLDQNGLHLTQIWITHGHYDHFLGAPELIKKANNPVRFAMNEESYNYASGQDLRHRFGMHIDKLPPLDLPVCQGDRLSFGDEPELFEVREAPGHCPGSTVYYCAKGAFAFVGDAIFRGTIGRTDLEGGNEDLLLKSIREQIFTLPPETILFPGHGEQTTVGWEVENNPFFQDAV